MIVSVENVTKRFGKTEVLRNVSFSIERGEIAAVIGPSGAGKTTLLRTINWLEKPDSGAITVGGARADAAHAKLSDVRSLRSKSSMVFQHFNLFRNKTALKNITESLVVVKKMQKSEAENRAFALLRSVGMEDKAGEYPSRLSGGQQQRVAIARALAVEPEVMLFDEPTSALDPEWVSEVQDVIKRIAAEGMTMILVSHEMRFVREVASRVLLLDGGAVVEDAAPVEIFNRPKNDRTKAFLNKSRDFEVVW